MVLQKNHIRQEQPEPVLQPAAPTPSDSLKDEFAALLDKDLDQTKPLDLPPKKRPKKQKQFKKKKPAPSQNKRALGRKQRASLPLGVVLWDDVPVFADASGSKILFKMVTGDFVRVFPNQKNNRQKIQPGVDLYLAATSKQFEAAGNRFLDRPGWADPSQFHVFKPKQAIEFTQGTDPITMGHSTNFSSVAFYERALRNPDPVVHRVVGPRFIDLLSIHEDYVSAWGTLYRDPDSKIRSFTLAALKKRGVGHNREIIEDLITRLSELTQRRAQGETETEVLVILQILNDTGNPRVPAALNGFRETWAVAQNDSLNSTLKDILKNQ